MAAQRVIEEIQTSGLHPVGDAERLVDVVEQEGSGTRDADAGGGRRRGESDVVEYVQYSSDRTDVSTQLALGLLYLQGNGAVERDFERAFQYLSDAAQLESPAGTAMLGFMYYYGYAVRRSRRRARELWEKTLELDPKNIYALSYLGTSLARAGDYAEAYDYLKDAAQRGSPSAQVELGHLYFDGNGVKQVIFVCLFFFFCCCCLIFKKFSSMIFVYLFVCL